MRTENRSSSVPSVLVAGFFAVATALVGFGVVNALTNSSTETPPQVAGSPSLTGNPNQPEITGPVRPPSVPLVERGESVATPSLLPAGLDPAPSPVAQPNPTPANQTVSTMPVPGVTDRTPIPAEPALITLGAPAGTPGSTILVYGSGFLPNEAISLFFGDIAGPTVTIQTVARSDGSLNAVPVTLPFASPLGETVLHAVGAGSGRLASTAYTVVPLLPNFIVDGLNAPGNVVTLNGTGFFPGEMVTISFAGDVWSTPADASGSFQASYVIPDVPTDSYRISAVGGSSGVSTTLPYFVIAQE